MAELDASSVTGLQAVDLLRRILEETYSTTVTFKGERRLPAAEIAANVNAQHIGVSLVGNVHVTGDIAGHTINKHA
jgi:hypothetical protein